MRHSRGAPAPGRSKPRMVEKARIFRRLSAFARCCARGHCTLHASSIPKGLCPPAQGWEERATLGNGRVCASTPKPQLLRSCAINTNNTMPQSLRVGLLIREVGATSSRLRGVVPEISQGSSLLATLGFIAGSLWDSRSLASIKILVRCSGDGRTPVIPRNLELKVWRFSGCWMLELGVFIFA